MCRIQFEGLLCPECQWEGEDGILRRLIPGQVDGNGQNIDFNCTGTPLPRHHFMEREGGLVTPRNPNLVFVWDVDHNAWRLVRRT